MRRSSDYDAPCARFTAAPPSWGKRLNSLRKALKPIEAGNKDVLHAPVTRLSERLQSELGSLGLGKPQAQHLVVAIHGDADGQVLS
jgi:hypothetical protein